MKVSAIVPAAGRGSRFGSKVPKQFLIVKGKPLLIWTLEALRAAYAFDEILLALEPERFSRVQSWLRRYAFGRVRLIRGGRTRAESVWNALCAVSDSTTHVLVHDAARPLVTRRVIRETLRAARSGVGAICGMPVTSTVKRVDPKRSIIQGTADRRQLYLAQTPQVFRIQDLVRRYRDLGRAAMQLTDEASFFDGTRSSVRIVEGDVHNLKITTPDDLKWFEFEKTRQLRGGKSKN